MPQQYTIIGYPLGHTMSPTLHNWGFDKFGIDAQYTATPTEPERLADFITAMRSTPIMGASVTIPHKEAVMELIDEITPRAQAVGAVNTLYWDGNKLMGENTDITGFLSPLRENADRYSNALVLGAGGAAKAVLAGLQEIGVENITICNRSKDRAEQLGEQFGVTVMDWQDRTTCEADLIINSTPLGMAGDNADATPYPAKAFTGSGTAYDLIYNPLQTRFLAEAEQAGWQTIDGLHMFAAQGIEQFRIWTGETLPIINVRKLIADTLSL